MAHDMPKPWRAEFSDYGGYDCMTGAWYIKAANNRTVCIVDQSDFGQKPCDHEFRSTEAEIVARSIANAFQ